MGEQEKLNEFEPADDDAWLALVERDLKGAPFEKKLVKRVAGIAIKPLYTGADRAEDAGLPGCSPYTRGSQLLGNLRGWDVRQEVRQADPKAAAEAVRRELSGETTSILLRLDLAAPTAGQDGVALRTLDDLRQVLDAVDLAHTPIALDAGASALAAAAALIALAAARGVEAGALQGAFGADPLGSLATLGALPTSLDTALADAVELARWAQRQAPQVRALSVDTSPYHEAGADAVVEIGLALASGVAYLRALTEAGLSVDDACRQLWFSFSVGRDFFLEIAKLRAARLAWAQVAAAAGASPEAGAMEIHARTSRRTKTVRDPWVNLLRGTAESFSAVVGGARAITTSGFDAELGPSDAFSARMARNTQHILRHEAQLQRVVDPAGGSWYIESVTQALAERAWAKFQSIEAAGGMAQVLLRGELQQELEKAQAGELNAVETRKLQITGVNEFPYVGEEKLRRPQPGAAAAPSQSNEPAAPGRFARGERLSAAVQALAQGASFSALRSALAEPEIAHCQALRRARLAEPFEALREAADRALARSGQRPSIFLANLGPIPSHKARASYAHNAFEAGGFHVIPNAGFASAEDAAAAFAQSGAQLAAICGSDESYASLAEPTARALSERGAQAVVLAGSPGDREAAYRAAGVSHFVHLGSNLVSCLRALLERAGAM